MRFRTLLLCVLPLAGLLALTAPATQAQTPLPAPVPAVRINVLRPLEFGRLIGGLEGSVNPDGSGFSAQFEVVGPPGASVQLIFTLPTELVGESGSRLDITFGPQSAAYSVSQSGRDLIPFDPRAPFTVTIPAAGRLGITVGGLARPSRQLLSGHYSGNLTLVARIL